MTHGDDAISATQEIISDQNPILIVLVSLQVCISSLPLLFLQPYNLIVSPARLAQLALPSREAEIYVTPILQLKVAIRGIRVHCRFEFARRSRLATAIQQLSGDRGRQKQAITPASSSHNRSRPRCAASSPSTRKAPFLSKAMSSEPPNDVQSDLVFLSGQVALPFDLFRDPGMTFVANRHQCP